MDETFLTPEQAAKMLHLSAYTIRAYAREGVIPAHKIGRTWRFSRADLEEWVLSSGQQPSAGGGFVARDRASGTAVDTRLYDGDHSAAETERTNARRRAIETLRDIRARARQASVLALVQDSRRDLLARGNERSDTE